MAFIKEEKPETGITTLSKYEFAKAELELFLKDYANYPVTPETYKESVKALSKIRDKRFHVQNTLKSNKNVLNLLKKSQEEEAEEFIGLIEKTEAPIAAGIKALDDARTEAKRKADQEEKDRLAKIDQDRKDSEAKTLQAEKDRLEEIRLANEAKEKELKQQEDDLKARQVLLLKQEQDAIDKKKREQAEADAKIKADQDEIEFQKLQLEKQKINNRYQQLFNIGFKDDSKGISFKSSLSFINVTYKQVLDLSDADFKSLIEQLVPEVESGKAEDKRLADEAEVKRKSEEEAAAKLKADEEAKHLEALKPEKEKLLHYANNVLPWNEIPEVKTPEARAITANIRIMLEKMQNHIIESVSKLK